MSNKLKNVKHIKNLNITERKKLPVGSADNPKDYQSNCNSNSFKYKTKDSCIQNNNFLRNHIHIKSKTELKEEVIKNAKLN